MSRLSRDRPTGSSSWLRLNTLTKAMAKETREFLQPLPCKALGVVVTNIPAESASYRYKYYRDREKAGTPDLEDEATARIPEPLSRA